MPAQLKIRPIIRLLHTVDERACCGRSSCVASSPSTSCVAPAAPNPTANSSACCHAPKRQTHSTISCVPSGSPPCRHRDPKPAHHRKLTCSHACVRFFAPLLRRALPRFCLRSVVVDFVTLFHLQFTADLAHRRTHHSTSRLHPARFLRLDVLGLGILTCTELDAMSIDAATGKQK
jgi:hypothetical protein